MAFYDSEDVILLTSSYLNAEGTVTNVEGRVTLKVATSQPKKARLANHLCFSSCMKTNAAISTFHPQKRILRIESRNKR